MTLSHMSEAAHRILYNEACHSPSLQADAFYISYFLPEDKAKHSVTTAEQVSWIVGKVSLSKQIYCEL